MANNQNTMRDMKRSILKAVRDSQRTKQDAMDEYVAARVNIKSLEGRLEEAREKATLLRRKAKDAGNTSAELKTADDLIDARWTGTEDGSAEDGSPDEMMSHSPFSSEVMRVLPSAMILKMMFFVLGALSLSQ